MLPNAFILYQKHPTKQALIYELGASTSVCSLLKIHGFEVKLKLASNVEYMSMNGNLPVVFHEESQGKVSKPLCGVSEVHSYVVRLLNKVKDPIQHSYINWIESCFMEMELFYCWCDANNYDTFDRFSYELSWPINHILFHRKRKSINSTLGYKYQNIEEASKMFNNFLRELNDRIVGNFFYSDHDPCAVDALIHGYTITSLKLLPQSPWSKLINQYEKIKNLTTMMERLYPSFGQLEY